MHLNQWPAIHKERKEILLNEEISEATEWKPRILKFPKMPQIQEALKTMQSTHTVTTPLATRQKCHKAD